MRASHSGSIAITSVKLPCVAHVFFMTTLPSSSRISALISPGLPTMSSLKARVPSRIAVRVSLTQRGQSESVVRGQPSCGKVRSRRLMSGAGALPPDAGFEVRLVS